jgi:AcrR family transcriptional regulator
VSGTARRPVPRGSARRAQVLDGLVDLFLAEGFLGFNLDDLAVRLQCSKSTLYSVAPSKEQLIAAVVRHFFREAAASVDQRCAEAADPVERIATYLDAIAGELSSASSWFFADLDAFAPAAEIYAQNTSIAAARVQELVTAATDADDAENAAFLGAVTRSVMESIQRGAIDAATGIKDATAYRLLADLIVAGMSGRQEGQCM